VLCELSAALGDETGLESAPDVLGAITEGVPFYGGLTLEEIGGRGVRWQDRPAAATFPESGEDGRPPVEGRLRFPRGEAGRPPDSGLQLGTYRDLWAGPVTEQSPALRFLKPQQRVEVAPGDADRLGLSSGDDVTVSSNGTSVEAKVAIRERMQEGAAFLIEGTEEGNANALLNGGARMVEIRKVEAE
jgi:NADH-quinone oxidoreductase subunit G